MLKLQTRCILPVEWKEVLNVKKLLIIVLVAVMVMSVISGCSIRKKLEQKAGEAIGEKMLEGLAGDDVNIDLDDDNIVIEGSDGEKFEIGSGQWPDSDLAEIIPKYDSGKIDSVFQTSDGFQITISDTDEKYFTSYLEKIKDDFSESAYEGTSEGSITYSGADSHGNTILIFYDEGECMITVTRQES